MKKRFLALTLALAMTSALLTGCGGSGAPAASAGSASGSGSAAPAEPSAELTATQKIIAEAEGMTLEELAKKAIEEIQRRHVLRRGQLQPRKDRSASVHRVSAVHRPQL